MKSWRKILFIVVIILPLQSFACDQCSCAAGGMFSNILPFSTSNFIGLRGGFYSYSSKAGINYLHTEFTSFAITGGYSFNRNLHVMGYLPYVWNEYANAENNYHAQGIGDAGLIANYILFSNRDSIMKKSMYAFSLKGGVELPTGKFNDDFRVDDVPASLSTGSGSIDLSTGFRYILKIGKTTCVADYTFRYNTTNARHYNFGEQHRLECMVSEKLIKSGWAFTPYTGITGEYAGADHFYDLEMAGTEGGNVFANAGCEFNHNKFTLGISGDIPCYSNFGETSEAAPRYNARIIYVFQ